MPVRKQILAIDEIYHVVNRGVASLPIFNTSYDYKRFLDLVDYYVLADVDINYSSFLDLKTDVRSEYLSKMKLESKRTIDIYAYCLMPNHFHFLVRQLTEGGIKKTFAKVQNALAKYVNLKNNRSGPFFQSRFRASRIESEEVLLHVSRYIHLNPSTSYLVKPDGLESYPWSSFPLYLGMQKNDFTNAEFILKISGGAQKYNEFVLNQADYQRKLNTIKHLVLE